MESKETQVYCCNFHQSTQKCYLSKEKKNPVFRVLCNFNSQMKEPYAQNINNDTTRALRKRPESKWQENTWTGRKVGFSNTMTI